MSTALGECEGDGSPEFAVHYDPQLTRLTIRVFSDFIKLADQLSLHGANNSTLFHF